MSHMWDTGCENTPKADSLNFKCMSPCHVRGTGMGKGGATSICHHANSHSSQPYVALNNPHAEAGDRGGCSVKRELSRNLSQSSRPVCCAHRQPGSLVGPTQLACTHLSDLEEETAGTPTIAPSHILHASVPRHLVDTESSV